MTPGLSAGRRRLELAGRRVRGWLGRREIAVIAVLLVAGAMLRPVAGMGIDPISVAPQYARSAMTLYEVLAEPGYLVPVARRTAETEVSPQAAVVGLLAGPEAGPDLAAPFAPGTRLLGFRVHDRGAEVELSEDALDGIDPGMAIDALTLTLTEFPGIASVSVRVGGDHVDADGAIVNDLTYLPRPVLNPETPEAAAGGIELYFTYEGEDRYLVPLTRSVPLQQREPTRAMVEFLAGPSGESDLGPVLPDDVGVLGVRVDGGLATVNFDSHLVYAYRLSKANAMFVRRAVMATLTGLPDISAGLIEIDGSRLLLYTCVNVTQEFPQARPWAINDEFYLTTLPSAIPAAA